MVDDLHTLMLTHEAQPLPVYKDNTYIEPRAVNNALKGALVEVHFCIQHYRIKNKDAAKTSDSFSGQVQQIIILQDGIPKNDNIYKRKNLLDGPFRPKPFTTAPKLTSQNLSGSAVTMVTPSTIAETSNAPNDNRKASGVKNGSELAPNIAPRATLDALAAPYNATYDDEMSPDRVDNAIALPLAVNAVAGPSNTSKNDETHTNHVDDERSSDKIANANRVLPAKKTKAKLGKEKCS